MIKFTPSKETLLFPFAIKSLQSYHVRLQNPADEGILLSTGFMGA